MSLLLQVAKDEKASAKKAAAADDTLVLKALKKPGAKTGAALSKEHLLRPDDADDEDPGQLCHVLDITQQHFDSHPAPCQPNL